MGLEGYATAGRKEEALSAIIPPSKGLLSMALI
jgi:hypothetical protein